MRNLALVWVLAACLLGCGGDKSDKNKAVSAADTTKTAVIDSNSGDLIYKLPKRLLSVDRQDTTFISWNCHPRERYPFNIDTAKLKLTGNRSKESVGRVLEKAIYSLRYVYNRRVRDIPSLSGTITVKFAIDEFGKVISAQVIKSTANDTTLENGILRKIQESHSPSPMNGSIHWYFGEINSPGDTTVVTYPFTFAQ